MMKPLALFSTLIMASVLLVACAGQSASTAENLELGKRAFLKQDYAQAFPKLFSAAQAGDASAAYAVGYMFYYGKGTKENKMLGMNWINRAASQGNETAKQALQIIRQEQAAAGTASLLK